MISIHGIPANLQNIGGRRRREPFRFIENQDGPLIRATYRKLRRAGFGECEARQMIVDLLKIGKYMLYKSELDDRQKSKLPLHLLDAF